MPFMVSPSALAVRPAAMKDLDASALRAIAQAAVNVELFTIPLYMATLYSIVGTHQITSLGNDFYRGRQWPGLGPTATPSNANERAFNIVFSVFIEEMMHLQIAANVATAIGAAPVFTSPALQDAHHGWTCYGPERTVIPHVVDLTDTSFDDVKVNLGALTGEQLRLFLAIEQPEADARKAIKPCKIEQKKYFPQVPFDWWKAGDTECDLHLFGSIGWMYHCYWDYLNLRYDDGTTLIDHVFVAGSVQNDMFNTVGSGHPKKEYPGFTPTLAGVATPQAALAQIEAMLSAITDQGEGSTLPKPGPGALLAVEECYRADKAGLAADYPGATDTGTSAPSADAAARADNDKPDHYERFQDLATWVDQVETWPAWFASGKRWTAADLQSPDIEPITDRYGLPTTTEVAAAINRMGYPATGADRAANYTLFAQASIGALWGMTNVLDTYWRTAGTNFPYPAMTGAGDRMGICWAVFGAAPDLSIGIGDPVPGVLQHSCQGLAFDAKGDNACAQVEIFHACRGSNNCQAQGGCGFVQKTTGGGLCGHFLSAHAQETDASAVYSVPSDNKCATFGGCAVPISASQLLNRTGTMELFDFVGTDHHSVPIGTMPFKEGEKVHDVAYRAYRQVMQHRGTTVPATPPAADDLRLIFIPST